VKTKEAYAEYLKTDHWKNLRESVLVRDGRKCVHCQSRIGLQAHHKFYRSEWTDSIPADLITLCRPCHKKEHGFAVEPVNPDFKSWPELLAARNKGQVSREVFVEQRKRLFPFADPHHKKAVKKRWKPKKKSKPHPMWKNGGGSVRCYRIRNWVNKGNSSN
jgi:hypothetical protein